MTLLHSIVIDTLGRGALDAAVFAELWPQFDGPDTINDLLLPQNPASPKISQAMFSDPYYGFKYKSNYLHWNALLDTADSLERLAWQWELRTYFALSADQIIEIQESWNALYSEWVTNVVDDLEVPSAFENQVGAAYWQWADQSITNDYVNPNGEDISMVDITNTVTGYPEMSYFISAYFMEIVSSANQATFDGVVLYNDPNK